MSVEFVVSKLRLCAMPLLQILSETSSEIGTDFWANVVVEIPSQSECVSLVIENKNEKKAGVLELGKVGSVFRKRGSWSSARSGLSSENEDWSTRR